MIRPDLETIEDVLDTIPLAVCLLDERGCPVKTNRAMRTIAAIPPETSAGTPVWSLPELAISRADRRLLKKAFLQTTTGATVQREISLRRPDQPECILEITLRALSRREGSRALFLVEGRDVTEYRQTIQALHHSEARFRTIFEEAGVGIVIKGVNGKMLDTNQSFEAMLGYAPNELVNLDYLSITHPLDRATSRRKFRQLVSGQIRSYTLEKRYQSKDGQLVWGRITTSIVHGQKKNETFVIGMVENISAQKLAEEELAEVQRHLTEGREMERLRIAQDLHDGPLQETIALSYQAKELEASLSGDDAREQLEAIQAALHRLTISLRSLCGEMRPPTLAPFGLNKAIQSHAAEFRSAHPEVNLELDLARDNRKLPEQVRIIFYRIYQEAMTNIARHARAERVVIRFSLDEKRAVLQVLDNGIGFELPGHWLKLARQGHLGLIGAMERARDIGGQMRIKTAPGKGTSIQVVIPLPPANPTPPEPSSPGANHRVDHDQ